MSDKDKVVYRLIGCECTSIEEGCKDVCPDDRIMWCLRDRKHIGKHFTCGFGKCGNEKHRIIEWD